MMTFLLSGKMIIFPCWVYLVDRMYILQVAILPTYGGSWRDGNLMIPSEPLDTAKSKASLLIGFLITKLLNPLFGLGRFELSFCNLQPKRILSRVVKFCIEPFTLRAGRTANVFKSIV